MLFARFLAETGPSVEWEKIQPPPEGSVSKNFCPSLYVDIYNKLLRHCSIEGSHTDSATYCIIIQVLFNLNTDI